jgi:hypothetical protein
MEDTPEAKIFIYFYPRATPPFEGHPAPGDWIVADSPKIVNRSQRITWKAVGDCQKLEVDLPDVFPEPHQLSVQGNTVSTTLRDDAPSGPYAYEVYCNDRLAIGGSSPIIIIDP